MVTTVTSTERVKERPRETQIVPGPHGGSGSRGNGSRGGGNGRGGGGDDNDARSRDNRARLGMWVALASILMLFTALTSAYIVRAGLSNDWRPISMPRLLWVSTGLIVLSSVTFEAARRALRRFEVKTYSRLIALTTLLGASFLVTQFMAWRQLVSQGIYLASNPHSSFFYVLTGAHALHLVGGIAGLGYLLLRTWDKLGSREAVLRRETAASTIGIYWHFMDGLWIYLFLLLFLWR